MKKILIISTGGTLASCATERGLVPGLGGEEILKRIAGLTQGFTVEAEELFQLDSSNMQPEQWSLLAAQGVRGVYVEAFGIGGMPFVGRDLTQAVGRASAKGMVVAIGSQCLYEGSDFSVYEVGRRVLEQGVVETGNMTSEAAVTKLMWALGQYESPEDVRRVMRENLAGELGRVTEWFS